MNVELVMTCKYMGKPTPQGSFTPMVNKHTGRAFVMNSPKVKKARESMKEALINEWDGKPMLTGPLILDTYFVFSRPKSHYRTGKNAHLIKDSAPLYYIHTPDTDKLVRLVGDSLKEAGVIKDDSLLVQITARKRWCPIETAPHTMIHLSVLNS